MRIRLELRPPEIKAEDSDENAQIEEDALNDTSLSSCHLHLQQTTPTRASSSAPNVFPPQPRRNRINLLSESDISALDIGPSLIQSHVQRTASVRVNQTPMASRTGFMRVLPENKLFKKPQEGRWSDSRQETRRLDRTRGRMHVKDPKSQSVTSGVSTSSELPIIHSSQQNPIRLLSEPYPFRLPVALGPHRPRSRLSIDDLESEAVTSGSASVTPELLLSNRAHRQDVVHPLPAPSALRRIWRSQVPVAGNIHMLPYGYGYAAYKYTHFDLATNPDHENSIASTSQMPRPRRGSCEPYPGIFTAGMADYERSLMLYQRLKDDSSKLTDEPVGEDDERL